MQHKIISECMGVVYKVVTQEGQTVDANETVIILESMKTEVIVESPHRGKVMSIPVEQGQQIDEGDVLVVLDS